MVRFETFWSRLKEQLSQLPTLESGAHARTVRKWSQARGYFDDKFALAYRGGNVIACETATTDKLRTGINAAEFRKVYEAWKDYRAGRVGRSYIVHDLGVHNASWIIPILREYEPLMSEGIENALPRA